MKTRTQTRRIIIHHSLSGDVSAETIDGWHRARGWDVCGYHFVIRFDGRVETGRHLHLSGAHAYGRNADSIGICVVGNFNEDQPTLDQYYELARVCKSLRVIYCDKLEVEYHHEGCPALLFDREFFETILGA